MINVMQPTKLKIIQAALEISSDETASKLSFDKLSKYTGLSKGGILYHFPSKQLLLESVVTYCKDAYIEYYLHNRDSTPAVGRTLRACLIGLLDESYGENSITSGALQSILREDPSLLVIHRQIYDRINKDIEADGGDIAQQRMLLASIDGLWMGEMLGFYHYDQKERTALITAIRRSIEKL